MEDISQVFNAFVGRNQDTGGIRFWENPERAGWLMKQGMSIGSEELLGIVILSSRCVTDQICVLQIIIVFSLQASLLSPGEGDGSFSRKARSSGLRMILLDR